MDIDKTLNDFVRRFADEVWEKMGNREVKAIGITGSFARGDYSKARPDVNFAIFTYETTPNISYAIGEIVSALNERFSLIVNLHPEYHPERFVYPWGRDKDKIDLFFKTAFFELITKNNPMPFGRPGYVSEGHKLSYKPLYGENYFKDLEFLSDNEEVLKGCVYTLAQWKKSICLTPLSYELEKDTDLFFNEAFIWGKLAIQQYAWIQGLKDKYNYSKKEDREKIFEKIHDKKLLKEFIKLEGHKKIELNTILEARLNYDKWKNNKKIAKELYFASCNLLLHFCEEAKMLDKEG